MTLKTYQLILYKNNVIVCKRPNQKEKKHQNQLKDILKDISKKIMYITEKKTKLIFVFYAKSHTIKTIS